MKNTNTGKQNSNGVWRTFAWAVQLFVLIACLVIPARVFGAFGYTDNGTAIVVDSGAGLVFQVRKADGTNDFDLRTWRYDPQDNPWRKLANEALERTGREVSHLDEAPPVGRSGPER